MFGSKSRIHFPTYFKHHIFCSTVNLHALDTNRPALDTNPQLLLDHGRNEEVQEILPAVQQVSGLVHQGIQGGGSDCGKHDDMCKCHHDNSCRTSRRGDADLPVSPPQFF